MRNDAYRKQQSRKADWLGIIRDRADAWSVNNDSEFFARSRDSFYKKTNGSKKEKQKELLEEYLEKRAQIKKQQQEILNEKIVKQEQERNRLLKSWNNEKLLAKASNAYEANVLTETMADGVSLLGGQRV